MRIYKLKGSVPAPGSFVLLNKRFFHTNFFVVRKIVQLLVLLLLLIVFPLRSWYYLTMGMGYRKSHLEELKELGPMPMPTMADMLLKTPLPADSLQGRWTVSAFVDLTNKQQAALVGDQLSELHKQFDERKDLLFLTFAQGDSTSLANWLASYKITDLNQCRFALGDARQMQAATSAYGITDTDWQNHSWMVFSDNKQMIRKRYTIDQVEEVKSLVEHIAVLLPIISRDEPVLKREKEK